jgi:protein phosphatase
MNISMDKPTLAKTLSVTHEVPYERFVQTLEVSRGALDVVGDIHGCMDELMVLLGQAGYMIGEFDPRGSDPIAVYHPEGRKLVLVGDLTDRGPYSDQVLRLAMGLLRTRAGALVMGNHDWKLMRVLSGKNVKFSDQVEETLQQIAPLGEAFVRDVLELYQKAPHQIRVPLDWDHPYDGASSLWITHAAAKAHRQGRCERGAFARSLYGYSSDELDADGYPKREDWSASYTGSDPVIHGHVALRDPRLQNRVLCIDTGCVFGNKMTLYRVDTGEFLFEAARQDYSGENRSLL